MTLLSPICKPHGPKKRNSPLYAYHLLASTFMTHRRILQEFAPAVVENVREGDSFVEVLAKVTLDSVKRYVDGFPLSTSKKKKPTKLTFG